MKGAEVGRDEEMKGAEVGRDEQMKGAEVGSRPSAALSQCDAKSRGTPPLSRRRTGEQ
jgi:hypothetical protein